MADERPIIIKRVKKIAAGSHGGAWKLAYADFVTAMMAFFLLMWLLGSVTSGDLKGIAEYFQNPWKPSFSGGRGTGDTTKIISGGGEDLTRSAGQVKMTNEGRRTKTTVTAEAAEGVQNAPRAGGSDGKIASSTPGVAGSAPALADQDVQADITAQELIALQQAKKKLEDVINQNEMLHQFSQQFRIDITVEGLRIQIVDEDKRPMFDLGSVRMVPYATEIMRQIAPIVAQLPNRISVTGHTDGRPYAGAGRFYSNWELSADRANAARRALVVGGVPENKFMRVVGLADSVPLVPTDPIDPTNRRISIIVMKKTAEQELINNSGPAVEVGKGALVPQPGAPVLFPSLPTQPKPFPSVGIPAQSDPTRLVPSAQQKPFIAPGQPKPLPSVGIPTQPNPTRLVPSAQQKPFIAPGQPKPFVPPSGSPVAPTAEPSTEPEPDSVQ